MRQIEFSKIDPIVTKKYSIFWIQSSILKIHVHENAYLELEDIQEIQIYKAQLTKNQPYGVLFITPNFGNISKEAKEFLASEKGCKNAIAKAVVLSNLGTKIIYNSFIKFNKPIVIHKAFTHEKTAMEWLIKYMRLPN